MSKIFENKYWSILWTVLRVFLGYEWLTSGWGKVFDPKENSVWVGSNAGAAIKGFLGNAIKQSNLGGGTNPHPSVETWYAWLAKNIFMPTAPLFSYLVAFGEIAVGLGLIFGVFTTIALYAGALMNLVYMLSGSAGVNPRMYTFAILLLVAGASAYSIGVDKWLIPWVKDKLGMKNTPPAT